MGVKAVLFFFYILGRDPQGFAFLLRWGAQYLWKEASETIGPSKHKSVTPRGCFCAPRGAQYLRQRSSVVSYGPTARADRRR